jgi:hypothetical protein
MKPSTRIRVLVLIGLIVVGGLALGEKNSIPGLASLVSTITAEVGRPLTPVSVAGVARRTSRRN